MARKAKKAADELEGLHPLIRKNMEAAKNYRIIEYDYDERSSYVPVGCRACGGDYPHCKQGCPMFDDE